MLLLYCIPFLPFLVGMIIYLRLPYYSDTELKNGVDNGQTIYVDNFSKYRNQMNRGGLFVTSFLIITSVLLVVFHYQIFNLFIKYKNIDGLVIQKDIGLLSDLPLVFTILALIPFALKIYFKIHSKDLDKFSSLYSMESLKISDLEFLNKGDATLINRNENDFPKKVKIYSAEKVASNTLRKILFWSSITVLVGGSLAIFISNNYINFTESYVGEQLPWKSEIKKITWENIDNLDLIHYEVKGKQGNYIEYNYALYDINNKIILENTWVRFDSNVYKNYLKIRDVMTTHHIPVHEQI